MNEQAHGIMFHHFHGGDHIKAQGSLSAQDMSDLIDWYGQDHHFIGAEEVYEKALSGRLDQKDVVLTFDDALRCQYDIAYPVLKDKGLTAFWFVYTSPMTGVYEKLEIYHHFRFATFPEIDDFYEAFFEETKRIKDELGVDVLAGLEDGKWRDYKPESTFYTDNDRRFRHARDFILGSDRYNMVMDAMMETAGYEYMDYVDLLWIKEKEIKALYDDGNIIGLHSHSHPTTLGKMSFDDQKGEYARCKEILEDILPQHITTVSYPCDSFNEDTEGIMKGLGIRIGFRAYPIPNENPLFLPREDHSNLYKSMRG